MKLALENPIPTLQCAESKAAVHNSTEAKVTKVRKSQLPINLPELWIRSIGNKFQKDIQSIRVRCEEISQ